MSNKNAFLAVALDNATLEALNAAAQALAASPAELLGMPEGTGFDPMDTGSLHMTFLFFGEFLRELQVGELRDFHAAVVAEVEASAASPQPPTQALAFRGFELFPPGKMNLVVARFEPTLPLQRLREGLLSVCREGGVVLPSSFFTLIEGEGTWSPHVTLGKIRASREDVGRASCRSTGLHALAPAAPLRPLGLTLLGERPPRAWCNWDEALAFVALPTEAEEAEADAAPRPASSPDSGDDSTASALGAEIPDAAAWVATLLGDPHLYDKVRRSKFRQYSVKPDGLLGWPQFAALSADLASSLGVAQPTEGKLRAAFAACAESRAEALSEDEFARFFKGFLRSSQAFLKDGCATRVRPVPGPGEALTPGDLVARWSALTWRNDVVEFKGRQERLEGSELRCFSNFHDEAAFDFELPVELSAPGLQLSDEERTVRCDFSEKAIMLCKAAAMGDRQGYEKIAASETPLEAKQLGKLVDGWDQALWDRLVCSVAFEVVHQKFRKIPALQPVLLRTGESLIVEATRADRVWGIGIDKGDQRICRPCEWRGANVLGWALMEARAALRRDAPSAGGG